MISETGVWNPLKGLTEFGWHFEQNVYFSGGLIRALKAGGGSGNIPKIIIYNGSDTEFAPRVPEDGVVGSGFADDNHK